MQFLTSLRPRKRGEIAVLIPVAREFVSLPDQPLHDGRKSARHFAGRKERSSHLYECQQIEQARHALRHTPCARKVGRAIGFNVGRKARVEFGSSERFNHFFETPKHFDSANLGRSLVPVARLVFRERRGPSRPRN